MNRVSVTKSERLLLEEKVSGGVSGSYAIKMPYGVLQLGNLKLNFYHSRNLIKKNSSLKTKSVTKTKQHGSFSVKD
jgi:hypothetical protein